MTGSPQGFLQALDHLRAGGEERWARAFVELIEPYASGAIPLSFWLMSAVDFWTDRLVLGWDAVEELPWFSDQERLLVVNFLVACTAYCHDSITYQKWRLVREDHMVFNHHTFPATGLFFGCLYLQRHGYELPQAREWLRKSLKVFARAATGRPLVRRRAARAIAGWSATISSASAPALGDVLLRSPPRRSIRYADLAAVIQNNAFELVPVRRLPRLSRHAARAPAAILLRAAEYHRRRRATSGWRSDTTRRPRS